MPRTIRPFASLLWTALLPVAACDCTDVPVTRVEVAHVVSPFDEACLLTELGKAGAAPRGEVIRGEHRLSELEVRVPGVAADSNIRSTTDAGEKGSPIASTRLAWFPIEGTQGTSSRVALDHRYMFGWGTTSRQKEIERRFTSLLETVGAGCGWTVGGRTCTRIEEEAAGRTLECLTLPAMETPTEEKREPTIYDLAPPEGLAPHVLNALAAGVETMEEVPEGSRPPPPEPLAEPPPPPPDYVPPPAYPDEWYGEQQQ